MKRHLDFNKVYAFLLVSVGLIWLGLDNRPLHHDESLNAIYGLYYYLDPKFHFYKYDPMLHGPFLYHLLPWVYHFIDESNFSIRFIPAFIFSVLPILVGIQLFSRLGWRAFSGMALLASGSSYLYWGGFLRHDQLVFFSMVFMGLAFYPPLKKIKAYLFIIPIFLQFCIKENAYLNLAILFGYIIFDRFIQKKEWFLFSNLIKEKWHLVLALLIGCSLYAYYYSAGFVYPEGIVDGIYRKSLTYWINQHNIERISGPFLTQFFTLFWYELPFIIFLFISIFKIHWNQKIYLKLIPFLALIISAIFHIAYGSTIPTDSLWRTFGKLQLGIDFYGFFFFIFTAISGTYILIKEKLSLTSFFYYLTMANFFSYSFVGEKVPWLSMYILIPGAIFLTLLWFDLSSKKLAAILFVAVSFNLYQSYQLKFKHPGASTEFISQVHTSREYESLAKQLRSGLENNKFSVLAYKENTWPLTWYLYKRNGYYYHKGRKELEDFDIILDGFPTSTKLRGYEKRVISLRHWWVPDWKESTLWDVIGYAFHHRPWNTPGSQKVTIFYKKGLLNL